MKLPKRNGRVTSVTNRSENHGEEKVLATSVKVEIIGDAKLLAIFHPDLPEAFFQKGEGKRHMLRHPEVGSFTWDREYADAEASFADMKFKKVALKDFAFLCVEGGVVTLSYKANFEVNEEDLGALAALIIEDKVPVSFETQFDLVERAEGEKVKDAPPTTDGQPIQPLIHSATVQ